MSTKVKRRRTHSKERGRIVQGGMGGFLNPPTHPEHDWHVETDLRRRPKNRGGMSLSAAAEATWLDPATRAEARKMLKDWQPPPSDSPEIVDWRQQVLGYFRGMYRNPGAPSGEEWHASNMIHDPNRAPIENADDHGGVNLIRRYYPDYVPSEGDFGGAYWGSRPESATIHERGRHQRTSESRDGEAQFEVISHDGRVIAHITAPTIEVARDDLRSGKHAGFYPKDAKVRGVRSEHARESTPPHRVADFDTLDDLIEHARDELGATHVWVAGPETKLYFPRGGQHQYEEARVWRKGGYWHAEGPGARTGVSRLPAEAQPIGGSGRRAAEARVPGVPRLRHGIIWSPSSGGTGWRGVAQSGATYLLRRAGSGHSIGNFQRWNLHFEGQQHGPFESLDAAKDWAEQHERGGGERQANEARRSAYRAPKHEPSLRRRPRRPR